MKGNVLVVSAHPDDEVLGCGGTIARLAREGAEVYIAILGEGVTSRYPQGEQSDKRAVEALQARSREVAGSLGAKDLFLYHLPDNRFDTVPLLDIVKLVEGIIAETSPSVIYTHHPGDLNIDHRLTFQATLTASRPMSRHPVREIYTFEIPSSTEWALQQFLPVFKPNVFVDVATTIEIKLKALQRYDTELRTFPHPRSPEALRAVAARWGSVAGLGSAEAFELVRMVNS